MCCASLYAEGMDVSDEMHDTLKARAASEGMSLSDYNKRKLNRSLERPAMREWLQSSSEAKPIRLKRSAAETIRQLRDAL
jgi:hypothetical protein